MDEFSLQQQFHKLDESGATPLVPAGLTVGWQSDEIMVDLKILKFCMDCIFRILAEFDKGTVQNHYSVTNAFQLFLGKVYCEACCRDRSV